MTNTKYKITHDEKAKIATLYIWEWLKWNKIDTYATIEVAEGIMRAMIDGKSIKDYYYDQDGRVELAVLRDK
jgi:hypothetical protein